MTAASAFATATAHPIQVSAGLRGTGASTEHHLAVLKAYAEGGIYDRTPVLANAVLNVEQRTEYLVTPSLDRYSSRADQFGINSVLVNGISAAIDAVSKEGYDAAVAVDGPRGPIYEVKSGVLKLAQQTGYPIVLGVASAKRRFIFKKAWNQCYLPLPFTRSVVIYGEPIPVPKDCSDEELETIRLRLQRDMFTIKAEAEATFKRQFFPEGLTFPEASPI